jgi:glycosyltransferase involved in cell wall biosynthesis
MEICNPVIWYIHPYAGGPGLGNTARNHFLAKEWSSVGAKVVVFCSSWHHLMIPDKQHNGIEIIDGVTYLFVPTSKYNSGSLGRLRNIGEFCWHLYSGREQYQKLAGKPDMIIASSPHPYCFLSAWRLARKWHSHLIFEVRDLWPLSLIQLAGLSSWHPLVLLTGWIERFAYRTADHVVSLLPGAMAHMGPLGLTPKRFSYIPNGAGITTSEYVNDMQTNLDNPALNLARRLREEGRFVVIYPGALGPPNNMGPLVKAAVILQDKGNDHIQIILMGQGSESSLLKDSLHHLGLKNFHMFPQAERNVALRLMELASAGYVSVRRLSIYRYGISFNKLFEYMERSLPVLFAADVIGNPVSESACGLITSPDDPKSIAASLTSLSNLPPEHLRAMGERGRQFVIIHHDYSILAKRYLTLPED